MDSLTSETFQDLQTEDKEKLEELMEKDSKSFRLLKGPWGWLVAALGASMVIFYLYTAGLATVGTEYHRGVYVFVTFALIFILYPSGGGPFRYVLTLFLGTVLGGAAVVLWHYGDAASFNEKWIDWYYTVQDDGWESGFQSLSQFLLFFEVSIAFSLFIHLADAAMTKRWPRNPSFSDILFTIISSIVIVYWIAEFEDLNFRAGAETEIDAFVSMIGVFVSLEACRRVLGWPMTIIGMFMLCFAYFGPYFPEVVAHRGFGIQRLSNALFLGTNGVFGIMANVLATYVILFIFFGAFLHKSGAGRFFIDLPLALAGRTTGGPAKVAVIASALFGSVSGSAIANTVSTGAFTIPLMKRAGFKPHIAGAIEPSASIGGMFLPPIMGAGGFLMAELTGESYAYIMGIAIAPALLYFFSVFWMIHFHAKKEKIQGIEPDEIPTWQHVLKNDWYFSIPLIVITVLMIMGRSPGFSAFWATISCVVISWFRKETRMGPREIWDAIQTGAQNTLIIGATLGVIGIIVGTISLTGIGLKFSDIIISIAGGNILAAVLLVGLASLVLGMGVPVTAAYLITAVLAVPPLMDLGVALIAAHMIVYWFSQDSNITPPVCVAAYAGAAIAGADPWKTGWTAFKFAKLLYVMPIMFAYVPAVLLNDSVFNNIEALVGCAFGTVTFSAVTVLFFLKRTNIAQWLLLAAATVLFFWPGVQYTLAGLIVSAAVFLWQKAEMNTVSEGGASEKG